MTPPLPVQWGSPVVKNRGVFIKGPKQMSIKVLLDNPGHPYKWNPYWTFDIKTGQFAFFDNTDGQKDYLSLQFHGKDGLNFIREIGKYSRIAEVASLSDRMKSVIAEFLQGKSLETLGFKSFRGSLAEELEEEDSGDLIRSFLEACQEGNLQKVKNVWDRGISIVNTEAGFIEACEKGHLDLVEWFVEKGVDVNIRQGVSLFCASKYGHLEIIKFLVKKGVNVHSGSEQPLKVASSRGFLKVVKFLAQNGADIHIFNEEPLYRACYNGHLDVIKFLVSEGADIHANGDAALSTAISRGNTQIVKYLQSLP